MKQWQQWESLDREERIKTINPFLDKLKEMIIDDNTVRVSLGMEYDTDGMPNIRNGNGELVKVAYIGTDVIEIELTRIKNNE